MVMVIMTPKLIWVWDIIPLLATFAYNPRHKLLVQTWAEIFEAAGLYVKSEPKEVFPDTQLRPDKIWSQDLAH